MDIRFYLDDLEIEQPIGWDSFELSMKRDETYHGFTFEAGTSALEFYGVAALYIKDQKDMYGVFANIIFRATVSCSDDAYGTYQEIMRGRLNMGRYKDECGATCTVTLPPEEESCRVTFNTRFDQKVEMDSPTAFDKITPLSSNPWINFDITLPAKALEVGTIGEVSQNSDPINDTVFGADNNTFQWIGRPTYERVADDSIMTGFLIPGVNAESDSPEYFPSPMSPVLLMEDNTSCFPIEMGYEFLFTGAFVVEKIGGDADPSLDFAKLKVVTWNGTGNIYTDATVLHEEDLGYSGGLGSIFGSFFDKSYSGTIPYVEGVGVYGFIQFQFHVDGTLSDIANIAINVTYAPSTSVAISATKLCPATQSKGYMVHEALSRITEAVTNRCVRVKSEYYGRTDSAPFSFPTDGCGSLRMLTNGLKIRQAAEEKDKFFLSPKEALEGLNAIDNIGFDIIDDPELPDKYILRVEPVAFFYQDFEMMALDNVKGNSEVQESWHYSRIEGGYGKWQVEQVNGLGETNAPRVFRTGLETISNPLNIQSQLVAGSYAIEVTRQQTFAESGKADTTYDDDTFIICLMRNAYGFEVERGNVENSTDIFDPATLYNYRITPIRNLMRWYKSIINSYPGTSSSQYKIFFESGEANLSASGELTDDACRLEVGLLAENQDLFYTDFKDPAEATPIWRNETITINEAMSLSDWLDLKVNPYGYINYQCGEGEYQKGYVQEIKFRVAKGSATFTLKKKW